MLQLDATLLIIDEWKMFIFITLSLEPFYLNSIFWVSTKTLIEFIDNTDDI